MNAAFFKKYGLLLAAVVISLSPLGVSAQSKEEVHKFFLNTTKKMNERRLEYSTPLNQFISADYDVKRSTLTYKYVTAALRQSGRSKFSQEELTLTKAQLADSGCRSLGAFMRLHNIQLEHIYFDRVGGAEVARFKISKRDCR